MNVLADPGYSYMTDKLYIVGNGFDRHHGIKSSYDDFGRYLKNRSPYTFEVMERYFDVDADFWKDFEERLASLDIETLIDEASSFLVSYGADNWSDAYHHDYQYEIRRVVEEISVTLRALFGDWIRQLYVPDPSELSYLQPSLDRSALYLNFNYTPSLQKIYNIPKERILHVHGSAEDPDAKLILGHGWQQKGNPDPYRSAHNPEEADMRILEGQSIVDSYFAATFKPTQRIIEENASFFNSLSGVTEILVMGHSISSVDQPYFREIIRSVRRNQIGWNISHYNDQDDLRDRINELGIDPGSVEFVKLSEF